jgi:dihydroorotase
VKKVVLHSPLDMHLHLRDKDMLKNIASYSARSFSGALIMPNLVPPITTKQGVILYKKQILDAIGDLSKSFTPYMSLFFSDTYTREFLQDIRDEILALKLYPAGITTNSQGGVSSFDIQKLTPVLSIMSEFKIPLCIHGESNGFVMDREKEFLSVYELLAQSFPDLKIIMEHITTKDSIDILNKYDNLYATVTLHHLLITLDDVVGGMLKPHLFCKPIAKKEEDRLALLDGAFHNKKIMFGSDSAPHPKDAKESCGCAAGVFTSPIAIEKLVELFDFHEKLHTLQSFISDRAIDIYDLTVSSKTINLEKKEKKVESIYNGVVPFCADEVIGYSIV